MGFRTRLTKVGVSTKEFHELGNDLQSLVVRAALDMQSDTTKSGEVLKRCEQELETLFSERQGLYDQQIFVDGLSDHADKDKRIEKWKKMRGDEKEAQKNITSTVLIALDYLTDDDATRGIKLLADQDLEKLGVKSTDDGYQLEDDYSVSVLRLPRAIGQGMTRGNILSPEGRDELKDGYKSGIVTVKNQDGSKEIRANFGAFANKRQVAKKFAAMIDAEFGGTAINISDFKNKKTYKLILEELADRGTRDLEKGIQINGKPASDYMREKFGENTLKELEDRFARGKKSNADKLKQAVAENSNEVKSTLAKLNVNLFKVCRNCKVGDDLADKIDVAVTALAKEKNPAMAAAAFAEVPEPQRLAVYQAYCTKVNEQQIGDKQQIGDTAKIKQIGAVLARMDNAVFTGLVVKLSEPELLTLVEQLTAENRWVDKLSSILNNTKIPRDVWLRFRNSRSFNHVNHRGPSRFVKIDTKARYALTPVLVRLKPEVLVAICKDGDEFGTGAGKVMQMLETGDDAKDYKLKSEFLAAVVQHKGAAKAAESLREYVRGKSDGCEIAELDDGDHSEDFQDLDQLVKTLQQDNPDAANKLVAALDDVEVVNFLSPEELVNRVLERSNIVDKVAGDGALILEAMGSQENGGLRQRLFFTKLVEAEPKVGGRTIEAYVKSKYNKSFAELNKDDDPGAMREVGIIMQHFNATVKKPEARSAFVAAMSAKEQAKSLQCLAAVQLADNADFRANTYDDIFKGLVPTPNEGMTKFLQLMQILKNSSEDVADAFVAKLFGNKDLMQSVRQACIGDEANVTLDNEDDDESLDSESGSFSDGGDGGSEESSEVDKSDHGVPSSEPVDTPAEKFLNLVGPDKQDDALAKMLPDSMQNDGEGEPEEGSPEKDQWDHDCDDTVKLLGQLNPNQREKVYGKLNDDAMRDVANKVPEDSPALQDEAVKAAKKVVTEVAKKVATEAVKVVCSFV